MSRITSFANRDSFDRRVWALVRRVPAGRVITYGQIAQKIDPPDGVALVTYRAFGARWVGGAMARCPQEVPWHRVVNAQGRLSSRRDGNSKLQRERLESEELIFDVCGRIELKNFGWRC